MIFLTGLMGILLLLYCRPPLTDGHLFEEMSFPPSPQDLYNLSQFLIKYMEQHLIYTTLAYFYLYILLQAFAIPGPIFLCLLSPTLFGPVAGFFICISVIFEFILVLLPWCFFVLFDEPDSGETACSAEVSNSFWEIQRHGGKKQRKSVLVYALPQAYSSYS